jgi:conflict system pore-forming effector with SLATT domain
LAQAHPTLDRSAYPALFLAAEEAAGRGQRNMKLLSAADIGFSLLATVIAIFATLQPIPPGGGRPTPIDIVLAATAIPFMVSVLLKLIGMASGFETDWQRGRAVAEQVKTMSWRYMMVVAPYKGARADTGFADDIGALLYGPDVREAVTRLPDLPLQITPAMRQSRTLDTAARRERYMNERLLNQVDWYQQRGLANRRAASLWFWGSVALQLGAVAVAVIALAVGANEHNGSDLLKLMALLATVSLAGTAWTERSRYDELAKSYSLTLQELLIVASLADRAESDEAFEAVVDEGEDAIMREHKLWLARRGDVADWRAEEKRIRQSGRR